MVKDLEPEVFGHFDETTNAAAYIVKDPSSNKCAIIDSVLDYDAASGKISTKFADLLCKDVSSQGLDVQWVLETHVHADHLSAAPYLAKKFSSKIAIGSNIDTVQKTFGKIFNAGTEFQMDGSQFDCLFKDGDSFNIGNMNVVVMHTPGHTPACVTYLVGGTAFIGDTLFMPDFGTARADFPGGSASDLYKSIKKILELPPMTRLFLCHDYKAPGRKTFCWETTVEKQLRYNIHVGGDVSEDDFVAFRKKRDKKLGMPKLIIPSIQVNMRAGNLPPKEDDGEHYLKVPINRI